MTINIRPYSRRGVVQPGRWEAYLVVKRPQGETIREKVTVPDGLSSRKAAQVWADQRYAHLMEHGKEAPVETAKPLTVQELIGKWLDRRAGAPSEKEDRQRLTDYVIPILGGLPITDIRPHHAKELLEALEHRKSRKGGQLAPRTIRSTYFLLKQVFQYAVISEWIPANPMQVEAGDVPAKKDKDPRWRVGARFSRDEVERLISDDRIPRYRRVAYAIEFLGGLRTGEASALRWSDYDATLEPLGRLTVANSYNTAREALTATKTEAPREIPVHPLLAQALAEWKLLGWRQTYGRRPEASDLIIPSTQRAKDGSRACDRYRRVNYALKAFVKDLELLGMAPRRHYDTRRTFISMTLDAGANAAVLRFITHPSPADAFDLYKTPSWPARCQAVSMLDISARGGAVAALFEGQAAETKTPLNSVA